MEQFEVVWRPSAERLAATHVAKFMELHGLADFESLRRRSIQDPEWFWESTIEYLGLPFDKPWRTILDTSRGTPWATWFAGSLFNLNRACVDRWADQTPDRVALRSLKETGEKRELNFAELRSEVSALAGALAALGVGRGDAVAVFLPMSTEAVISLLAVARIGAIFIPIFSGYGAEAVAGRLIDPKPKVLICANGFVRRGSLVEMKEVADRALELAAGVSHVVVVEYAERGTTPMVGGRDLWWKDALGETDPHPVVLTAAEDPFLIAYTSGTTGRPKGAVHVHGGFGTQVAAEGAFQFDFHQDDTVMWVTDMGWIMGPWIIIAGLANGSALATYDGAPDYPGPDRIWQVASELELTFLGVSPTLVRALRIHGAEPAQRHDLSRLRTFGSTGEPWNPEPWWWLFRDIGGESRPIINISGGTEIGAVLLSVNVHQGMKPTSLGGPSLGVDADVYDSDGNPMRGEVGELVVRGSWPGRTRGFWNEPDRYLATYWERFDDTWVHGDWASIDDDGFWFLHGRSDDTLNIAGKRIGPAEIESTAVAFPEVAMAAAIGIPDEIKGEVIALYLVAAEGVTPDDSLSATIERAVVESLGKSFRPQTVRWVGDLPRTRSAKIMRRVIKAIALGEEPGDVSSLENPESLKEIEGLA
ncbi:MAG TPA: AMP-binding protein [Acidimicrobiia bacterium]